MRWPVAVRYVGAAICALVLMSGCGQRSAPKPSYAGPVVSPYAQQVLAKLAGKSFADTSGALGGGRWVVGGFAVVPNRVSAGGMGPVVMIRQGQKRHYLPMEYDGDAADLYERVRGQRHALLDGKQSENYQRIWRGAEAAPR
jgi:hypothetical protein